MVPHRIPYRRYPFIMLMAAALLPVISTFAMVQATPSVTSEASDINRIRVLDLKAAQRIALAENPSFAAAAARVEQARARLSQARSAYFPRLDISASAARVRMSDVAYRSNLATAQIFDPTATIEDPKDYYAAGLTASWILFNGFERYYTHVLARDGERLSQSAYRDAKRMLLSAVASAYYAAQLARENIDISDADQAFNQRQLQEAKARRRVGTGSLSDELNFQVRVNAAQAQVIQTKQIYDTAMFALASLLGLSSGTFSSDLTLAPLEPETPKEMNRPSVEPLLEYAQKQRPDIVQRRLAVQQSHAGVNIARAKLYPSLNVIASVDGDRIGDDSFGGDDFGKTIALSVSYPLFAGGLYQSKLREAKAQKVEAEKTLENLTLAVGSQVRSATARVTSAQAQLQIQRRNAALVQKNRDLVEKEYVAGQGSLVRLNQAQRDLTAAQGRLALALVSLRQAWFDLQTKTAQILADRE